ncbi:uncharacterized protein LOC127290147 [Leptopilina boulardi]|uniref:uncharacterized protein LOC127290147 n=1 Tax=Leptopilina boulardi TaxID=63433 RepID=UPI0021F64729|nr:uncharacterized protein LOC127290147 [Leptopilina boulardi]
MAASEDKIPEVVAELERLTVKGKRVLRKRLHTESDKRRCRFKPLKRKFSEMENEEDARSFYLDKSVKESPHTLETIYEEKEQNSVDGTSEKPQMSVKRFKRMINFHRKLNDNGKQKKRRLKIKREFGTKLAKPHYRRMELKDVLKRLELIHSNSTMDAEHNE